MIGDYDHILPIDADPRWDCVMFTDFPIDQLPSESAWTFVSVNKLNHVNDTMANRWYKMHPHLLFPEYEYSIYIDSNIQITDLSSINDLVELIRRDGTTIGIAAHPIRDCIYAEAEAVLQHGKDTEANILRHVEFLRSKGYPENAGLYENNFIYRQHSHPDIIKLMEQWWDLINTYSHRDQLSLCYLLWRQNVSVKKFFGDGISARNHRGIEFFEQHKAHEPRTQVKTVKLRVLLMLVKLIPVRAQRQKMRSWVKQNIL
jgi:hypothetical protein